MGLVGIDLDALAFSQHFINPPYGNTANTTFQAGVQVNHKFENFLSGTNLITIGAEHLYDDIEVFEKSIVNILENIQNYVNLPGGATWDDQTIKDIDIDYTIEKGMKRGQLHIHILFKFVHFTRIQLNYAKIKEKINTD